MTMARDPGRQLMTKVAEAGGGRRRARQGIAVMGRVEQQVKTLQRREENLYR